MKSVTCRKGHGREGWVLLHATEEGLASLIVFHMVTAHPGVVQELLAEQPLNHEVLKAACLAFFEPK